MALASSENAAPVVDPVRPSLVRLACGCWAQSRILKAWFEIPSCTGWTLSEMVCGAGISAPSGHALVAEPAQIGPALARDLLGTQLPDSVVGSGEGEVDELVCRCGWHSRVCHRWRAAPSCFMTYLASAFEEVAATIGRNPSAYRQLAVRARTDVCADRPRDPLPKQRGFKIAEAFFAASPDGRMERPSCELRPPDMPAFHIIKP